MKAQHQEEKRRHEAQMDRVSFPGSRRQARTPREHHQQTEILSRVVPRAPADIQRENPGKQRIPDVRNDAGQRQQQRDMHGENPVFLKFRVRVVRAVDRSHEVRVIAQQCQKIKRYSPGSGIRRCRIESQQEKRRGPTSASDRQIDPGTINPRTLFRKWRRCGLCFRGCEC